MSLESRLPLALRPSEIARTTLGYLAEYAGKVYGTASAANVLVGPGETVQQKVHDALHTVPDFLAGISRARFIVTHQQEINAGLEYVSKNAQPERLEQIVRKTEQVANQIVTANQHFAQAGELAKNWHPLDAAAQIYEGVSALPDIEGIKHLGTAAEHTGKLLGYLRQIDFGPLYSATINFSDNFSGDEVVATAAVALGAFLVPVGLGSYLGGIWARRGRPGILAKLTMSIGARRNPEYWKNNGRKLLGNNVYDAIKEGIREEIAQECKEEKRQL